MPLTKKKKREETTPVHKHVVESMQFKFFPFFFLLVFALFQKKKTFLYSSMAIQNKQEHVQSL